MWIIKTAIDLGMGKTTVKNWEKTISGRIWYFATVSSCSILKMLEIYILVMIYVKGMM